MTFQELQVDDYFRISGMISRYTFKKASDSHCSVNILLLPNYNEMALLQPIRAETEVIPLTKAEITEYFNRRQESLENFPK